MVDWSFDRSIGVKVDKKPAPLRPTKSSNRRGPLGAVKSRRLVEHTSKHFIHSGVNRNLKRPKRIRKVLRDSSGQPLTNRENRAY